MRLRKLQPTNSETAMQSSWRKPKEADKRLKLENLNLSRVLDGKVLVDAVTMQVQPGAVLAVLGPSGAGKSSFLRLLNRLDEPTAGTVLLDGQDYRSIAPQQLRRRVGMAMQTPFCFLAPLQRISTSGRFRPVVSWMRTRSRRSSNVSVSLATRSAT
jgi:ABC-type bacteriocin/lantibiotic exporter with double-glycine peptidase domain